MRCRTRALVGGLAGMAVPLVALVPGAAAQGGGTSTPSHVGGSQYGAALTPARPARPVARYFRVGPRAVVSPAVPKIALRVDEVGASTVKARVVFMPQSETGSIVRLDLGRLPVGQRFVVTWPAGTTLAPGRYRVRLHVRGLRGTVLYRKATAPGRTTFTVRAPEPAPTPLPDAAGHVFPVNGPHTYGDVFGAPRNGYTHQGQDISAAEGTPVVAPVAGAISFTDYQAKAAGYYIVEKGSDGYDYFFAHCQKDSTVVTPGLTVFVGQQLCNVGATGDASGSHLHFEAWQSGWRVDANSHPIDPLPMLRSWDVSAPPAAARR
jgi:murein DD-endopeptidase MepM/ murein hydrolase activator NlpD